MTFLHGRKDIWTNKGYIDPRIIPLVAPWFAIVATTLGLAPLKSEGASAKGGNPHSSELVILVFQKRL